MKIKSVVFLLLLFGGSSLYSHNPNSDLCESLVDNIMMMWTKIDIVRAINTDHSQKKMFLEDLISDSFDAYYLSRQMRKAPYASNIHDDNDMVNLVASVRESFKEVFSEVNNDDFYAFCLVLRKIVHLLKTPENIDSYIAT